MASRDSRRHERRDADGIAAFARIVTLPYPRHSAYKVVPKLIVLHVIDFIRDLYIISSVWECLQMLQLLINFVIFLENFWLS